MFKKILIANRGEIAVRIIRACKEMEIETVAVYSDVDQDALHVKMADETVCIGPAALSKSYLKIPSLIAAAEITGSEAIHPGYGFLSENADFSDICSANKIKFIGASGKNIRLMGNKSQAKKTVEGLNIPTVPGSNGVIKSFKELDEVSKKVGYPLLIKASAGGGGKGMRIVEKKEELHKAYEQAKNEAKSVFGNGDLYIEKYIENPRHIEIQLLSDGKHAIHLGERECSIQRRHQKLIEEAPSTFLTDKLRKKMGEMAITIAKGIEYQGAGTIEFLMDKDQNFYFMEMNTRIQVEHPVTEMISGIDLVKQQIKIAYEEKLTLKQKEIQFNGHAIEFRINAENYLKDFQPSPGKVSLFLPPGGYGVRTDSFIYPEYEIKAFYDSLIGKLIIFGRDRKETINRAKRALDEFILDGVSSTIPFHKRVINHKEFQSGNYDTNFVETKILTEHNG
ncbi:MAG: acetyl-CoA carboxylase biotin carboxylase subunit [bacterium]